MSVEILRKAAALMRERAEEQRKPHHPYSDKRIPPVTTIADWSELVDGYLGGDMGAYCASWHPAVALAVADWLDDTAQIGDVRGDWDEWALGISALAVARAYVGEAS